jgi:hypothetical protein
MKGVVTLVRGATLTSLVQVRLLITVDEDAVDGVEDDALY